jgi:hypothetical protein
MQHIQLPDDVLATLPTPIVQAFEALKKECDTKQAYLRQVYRLIDLIESLCKIYTVASVSTFLDLLEQRLLENEADRGHVEGVRITLAAGLRTPSLGIWWRFARDSAQVLRQIQGSHVLPGGIEMLTGDKSPFKKAFDGDQNLIAFRNSYAHGATPSEEACAKALTERWETMRGLIIQAQPLMQADLLVVDPAGKVFLARGAVLTPIEVSAPLKKGHLYFRSESALVDLHPLLTYREDGLFYFYNDLKENFANFLNYPQALHYRDPKLKEQLLQRIPILKWHQAKSAFAERIELLTEVFKGRSEEIDSLAKFVQQNKLGFYVVWGNPGIGKSALLARFAQLMGFAPEVRKEYDQGTTLPEDKIHLIEYFIRRSDKNTDKAINMLESLSTRLNILFDLKENRKGKMVEDWKKIFEDALRKAGEKLQEKEEKLVLIIDGLDEADPETPLIASLPRFLPAQVLVLYGSRPTFELKNDFYDSLDRENKQFYMLTGFKNQQEIRAILMEYVSKYDLQTEYIEAILEKSEGNPLYLKLLCNVLTKEPHQLNNISRLPSSMEELYTNAMVRLGNQSPAALDFLILLAAARDFLTPQMAAAIQGVPDTVFNNQILPNCLEFLYENPLTVQVEDYQLFHESLREFLKQKYADTFRVMHGKLADYCANWTRNNGDLAFSDEYATGYAMAYAIPHLYSEWRKLGPEKPGERKRRQEQILALTDDQKWRELNFDTLGNGEALRVAYTRSHELLLRDTTGALDSTLQKRLLHYTLQIHEEPLKLYARQLEKLKAPHTLGVPKEELLGRILQIAKMGDSPIQKMLLIFLAVWSMAEKPVLNQEFADAAKPWLEAARDKAVEKLWQLSFS